ncbi:hypothetical protein PUV47_01995 [Pseudovibrio exalbescens]|uniref:hypothetical protein n=1 Tax=Pseudovibrio exalbescens TaxID=197461 RepID=UPI002366C77D|nr:hypothetical protein [Pseudovibrio exalbescens]MDD7908676.1 hypothetical protein [Pseudovibrio exalbescens]
MAQLKGLNKITHVGVAGVGPGSVRNLWGYVTADNLATVGAAGYFNDFAEWMTKGDQLMVTCDVDATPVLRHYVVTAVSASSVTIAPQNVT